MTETTLDTRALNRALLARQMLLERAERSVVDAIAHLVGMQSQIPNPAYIGLWTRLADFRREDLTGALERREVVRAAMLRSTLHLVAARDHDLLRATLEPALRKALRSFFGPRARRLDETALVDATRALLAEAPAAMGAIREALAEVDGEADPAAMSYLVRSALPIVQVPPAGTWGAGTMARYVTAAAWLQNHDPGAPADPPALFRRYLAAFGPASVADFQTWSGLTRMKKAVDAEADDLLRFRDEVGTVLHDLPEAPRPPADAPAPARLVPEYDNLLIGHKDRCRVLPTEHHKRVFLSAGRVRATLLVGGFVAGAWRVESARDAATLVLEPFVALAPGDRDALVAEAERMLAFVADDAAERTVRVEAAA